MYACWPDGSPGTTINVSCPFYLPWFEKGEDPLLPRRGWKPGLSRSGGGDALRVCLTGAEGPMDGVRGCLRLRAEPARALPPPALEQGTEQGQIHPPREGFGGAWGTVRVLRVRSEARAGEPQVRHRRPVGDGERQPALEGLLAVRG